MEQNKKTTPKIKIVAVKKSRKEAIKKKSASVPTTINLSMKIVASIIILAILATGLFLVIKNKKETASRANQANKNSQPIEPGKVVDLELLEEGIPDSAEVITQGRFNNVEQILEGKALFIESEGERYLRFENFKVVNGQDIHVYLSPISNLDKNDVVDLGLLKSTSGNFNYPIDKKIDLAKYNNVLIWSNTFNAFFGYASLISKELPPEPQATPENQNPEENNDDQLKIDKENPQMPPVIPEENAIPQPETTPPVTNIPVAN